VTDGVFTQSSDGYCVKFFPAQPITATDLATLTERVRCRVVRWSRMQRLLDADAAAAMLRRENSGVSVDASVDVPSYFQSLEYLLRYRARPPFALERLSVRRGEDGRISRVRYVLPRHKAANWVGPGRGPTQYDRHNDCHVLASRIPLGPDPIPKMHPRPTRAM
jgi:hypothetical protein